MAASLLRDVTRKEGAHMKMTINTNGGAQAMLRSAAWTSTSTTCAAGAQVRRKITRVALFLVVSCALPRLAAAQGIFVEQGKDAFGAALTVSSDGPTSALAAAASYSIGGSIDVGLSVQRYRFDDYYFASPYQVRGTGVSLFSSLQLARQEGALPVSLGATGGVQMIFFSSDFMRVSGDSSNGWSAWAGGFACRRFQLSERISAIPQVTLGLVHASFSQVAWGSGRYSSSGESILVRLDGHFSYKDGGGRQWIVTPFIGLGDYSDGSGLSVGGVFP